MADGSRLENETVKAEASPAVIDDRASKDINIQTPAIVLPVLEVGARSP